MKKHELIVVTFSKSNNEVSVSVANDHVGSMMKSSDSIFSSIISGIKSNIPEKYKDKKVTIKAYLEDYDNNISVRTTASYRGIRDKSFTSHIPYYLNDLNKYFSKVVRDASMEMEARQVDDVSNK